MTKERYAGTTLYGRVIDGTLNPPLENGAVAFQGDRIAWVGAERDLPSAYAAEDHRQIRLPGRSILPGMIDGHTHISFGEARSEEELALYTPVEYRRSCRRASPAPSTRPPPITSRRASATRSMSA
jgi:imidazolonepropionase-like amidohydrolase